MVSTDIAERERFVVLDGMRGLAALAVITDHVDSDLLRALLPGRYLAVDFFFVLSGFVLAHVYAKRLESGMSVLGFLRVRLIRLYPLYLLGLLVGAALALLYALKGWSGAPPAHVWTALLFGLFMLPCPPGLSIWPNAPFPLNGPSWSLFFELFVNALYAAVARWLTPARCLAIMAVSAVLLAPVPFLFGGQLDAGYAWSNFIGGFPRVTFTFFAGVWLQQMHARRPMAGLPAWAAFAALLAILAVPAQGVWRSIFDLSAALILFPALVAFSASSRASGTLARTCAGLGLVSYGVYVLHVPMWGWLRLITEHFFPQGLPGAVNVAIVAACAVTAVAALHFIYDVPVRRFLSRRRPAAVKH